MCRVVRKVLISVLHQQTVTGEALVPVRCKAEVNLNDQAITKVSEDPKDLESFTPYHLLTLKRQLIFFQACLIQRTSMQEEDTNSHSTLQI